jgi:D-alanyl-D-alanine carboxypeptidase/D-alanyl-D-alanine-endopeptidase (penicillin-binding protein 4)
LEQFTFALLDQVVIIPATIELPSRNRSGVDDTEFLQLKILHWLLGKDVPKRFCFSLKNPRSLFVVAVLVALCVSPLWARKKKIPPPTLARQVEQILNSSPIAVGFFGIEVYSLDRSQTVYEKNAGQLFVPASNTKIFTTATAVAKLPADFRFHTTLESSGQIDKFGRLIGDLIFVGRGDPNLSNRVLPYDPKANITEPLLAAIDTLAGQLVAKGIKVIDGDIVGDDSYFINEPYGFSWGWDDLMWSSAAPASALTINDNVFGISMVPGEAAGDHALVTIDPFYPSLELYNETITTAPGTERKIYLERLPGSRLLRLWGTMPQDAKPQHELLAIEEPARVAAEALRGALLAKGVRIYGKTRAHHRERWDLGPTIGIQASAPSNQKVLAEIVSHPLQEDLRVIDKVSQNLHAELLLRLLGAQLKNEGSVRAGLEVEKEFLKQAGVDEKLFQLNDGSGMDPHNLVAPHALIELLRYIWAQPYRNAFINLLPISAGDGTIASRFKDTAMAGKVFAKTGTLAHVNALSGYALSPSGEHFAFSILVNNHTQESKVATATMDKILETILTAPEPGTASRATK